MVIKGNNEDVILTSSDRTDIVFDPDSMLDDQTVPVTKRTGKLNVQPFVIDSDTAGYKIGSNKDKEAAAELYLDEVQKDLSTPKTPEELSLYTSQPVILLKMTTNGSDKEKTEDHVTLVCNLEQISVKEMPASGTRTWSATQTEYTVSILSNPIITFALSDKYLFLMETQISIKGESIVRTFEVMPRLHDLVCKDFEDTMTRCQLTFL